MMPLPYSEEQIQRAAITLENIKVTIAQLLDWNKDAHSTDFYYSSEHGTQLLAANCTLITAIGEGINRVNRMLPDFLISNYPQIPWRAVIGMRNHIAHGYFELDADIVYDAVKNDFPQLLEIIEDAIQLLN